MRKLFTFLLTMVVAMVANAAITPTIQLGEEFKSVADLDGKTFAIVNKAEQKALFGSSAQNLGYDVYSNAFVTTNSGYLWKLVSLADNADESIRGYYMLRLITPSGGEYNIWGSPGFLNTQPADQAVSFILGITGKKNGQDIDNGAVYDVQYEEGKGFSLKNIGTGLYQGANTAPAKNEEPTYFTFATVTTTYVPALKALLAEGEAMKKRGASSADYDAAIEGIDPDKSADALADAQKVEAALPALAKTQLTAGSDFTRAIANFDCAAKDGWTFDKPKGGNGPDHGGDFEYWAGNASNRAEASFDYWQEITGLPNGTYTVSAEMYNSLNNEGGNYTEFKPTVGVYATVGEKTVSKLVDVNSETRVPYVTDVIEVTDGKIRIGVKSFEAPMAARWFTVDNFKLTLVKPAVAPTAPEKDKWFNEIDFCFRDKASSVATSTEKTFAVWGADPDDVTNGCIVATAGKNSSATNAQFWIRGAEFVEPTYIGKDKAQLTAVYDKGGFAAKTGFKVTMRVKADGEYSAGSQTHKAFQHISNDGFGTLNVTKEWQTVTFVCIADDARAGFTDLCFNLAASDADRTFYFDDVKIEGRGGSEWYLNNEFHAKDYKDPTATYSDGQDPHPAARFVSDAEGGYVEVISNAGGNQTYNSQLWIAIPAEYVGKSTKMTMEVQASKAIKTPESFQATATGNGWGCNPGPGAGLEFSVGKWTTITRILKTEGVKSTGTWKDLQADQYCLDLTEKLDGNAGEAITYKFRNVKFEQAAEDWYEQNVIVAKDPAVDYEDGKAYDFPAAPYVFGTGEEGGYIEVKSKANPANEWASQIFFTIPEDLAGKQVAISMKVKASKAVTAKAQRHQDNTGSTYMDNYSDANIDFTTEWNKVSVIVDTKKENGEAVDIAKCFVLNLAVDAEALTFDFDSLKFEQYFAPVDYGELIEIPLEGTVVMERDFTKETSYTHSPNWANNKDGYTDKLIVGEGLEIVNTADQGMWDSQFFIMEGFNLVGGRDYAVRYTLKYEGDGGDMQINMGDWTNNDQGVETLAAGPIYTQMVRLFPSFKGDATGAHVFFQSGAIKGRMIVEKVEVIDITPNYDEMDWSDNILKNGDLTGDDMSAFILKNNDVENPEMLLAEKSAIEDGFEIGIETAARPTNEDGSVGGNDHDAQFFVRLPYVLPKGTLFNFEFDLYAEEVNTIAIQAHDEPGQYKANLSSVKTDPSLDAVHFQEYLKAPQDMRTIAFNLAVATDATYGFSNIKVQIVNDDKAAIEAATATADAATLWAETLALNEACYAGRTTETEGKGYSEDLVKALTDAIAAGKAALAPADGDPAPTKESLTAAAKAITDAIAALEAAAPLADCDLTADMFFTWDAVDATAKTTGQAGCAYDINKSTGMPYGDGTVNEYNYADLSGFDHLAITATEGEPRLLFNRAAQDDHQGPLSVELPRDYGQNKYEAVVDNGDGSKTFVINLKEIVAKDGYAHLHAIKGANWANTTVTEMKLFVGESEYTDVLTAIEEVAEDAAVKDGKYFINGQIVIVKNGVKYNAAGVVIQ